MLGYFNHFLINICAKIRKVLKCCGYCRIGRGQGAVSQKILRLRYTLETSSSSWRNTTGAIVSQQTIVTTTSSHSYSLFTFENTRNHEIMIFVKPIFAPVIGIRLRSLLRFFVKRGPAAFVDAPWSRDIEDVAYTGLQHGRIRHDLSHRHANLTTQGQCHRLFH